jgi:hypothetical protein
MIDWRIGACFSGCLLLARCCRDGIAAIDCAVEVETVAPAVRVSDQPKRDVGPKRIGSTLFGEHYGGRSKRWAPYVALAGPCRTFLKWIMAATSVVVSSGRLAPTGPRPSSPSLLVPLAQFPRPTPIVAASVVSSG